MFKERLKYFETTLNEQDDDVDAFGHWSPTIDMKEFREACFQGIPEESGVHATAWKVLLGYLPPDKTLWQSTIYDQRLSYYNMVNDILEQSSKKPPAADDHPLNSSSRSELATYLQDNNVLEQIDKDVRRRTLPDFSFFQQHVPQNPLNPLSALTPPAPVSLSGHSNIDESGIDMDPLRQNDTRRRFSFGIMGRPRSGSNTSKKSLKINNSSSSSNTTTNSTTIIVNRSRSNSRSSALSLSSGMAEIGVDNIHSPRNLVRKISTAFSKSGSSMSLSTTIKPKKQSSLTAMRPICPYIPNRRLLFKRIEQLQQQQHIDIKISKSKNYHMDGDEYIQDYHWEVIERILFMYAKLNPGIGYVQGMNELVAPIYYVFANDTSPGLAGQVHAEADTFFVFTILMGDVRDHFVRSLDQDASTGIHGTMFRLQQRLAWYDKSLWRDLQRKNVKEPYYAFRWITVLFSQEWDFPDVIRLWDSFFAERGMQTFVDGATDTPFEFLLDFSVAMVVCLRQELLKGDFAENIKLLQNYPINDIQYVLTVANRIRETRLQMVAMGQIVPGVNDMRHSGVFNSDWSDTSSISSTASTASSRLHQRLRESTDLAKSSFDSFRRESRESMDEMFRRGMAASGEHWKRANASDMKRSLSQRVGLVKNSVFNKARRSGSVRSTVSDSSPSFLQSISTSPQHWLLANQFNTQQPDPASSSLSSSSVVDQSQQHHGRSYPPHHHLRSRSTNTNDINSGFRYFEHQSTTSTTSSHSSNTENSLSSRSSKMLNRFSHLMVSDQHTTSDNQYQRSPISSRMRDPLTTTTNTEGYLLNSSSSIRPSISPTSNGSNPGTNNDDSEELLFAKAAAARDEALHYRTSTAYKGCV